MFTALQPDSGRKSIKGAIFFVAAIIVACIGLVGLVGNSSAAGIATGTRYAPTGGCSVPNFGPPSSYPAGGNPVAVKLGDFNLDGDPDAAVADYISDEVSVLLGDGNGG